MRCASALSGADAAKSSVVIAPSDDEVQLSLPVAEEIVVCQLPRHARGVPGVALRHPASGHPRVAGVGSLARRVDVDVVGTTGGPVVAGAFAVVVLPRRAQA